MSFSAKVYSFIQRTFAYTGQIDTSGKYIAYGPTDNLPNEINDLVEGSPTATSCLSTLTDFVAGEGFNLGEELENKVINKQGLKFYNFHLLCSDSIVHNWGVASIIKYNKGGKKIGVYDVPFGYCRLGEPDDNGVISKIKYNPYFGTTAYQQKDTVTYDVYNPSQAVIQEAKFKADPKNKDKNWPGQIYWIGIRDRRNPFYPVPDYYSAKYWMRVEKNAGIYFDDNLENGFLNDTIMKMIGDPNDPSGQKNEKDEDITKGELFDQVMTRDFAGAKNRHKILALWGNNKEEWPDLVPFPTAGNPDLFRVQDEHATKKITIATKVPAILANISEGVSLGGDGNTIRAAVKLTQQRALRYQAVLTDYYQEILKDFETPIDEPIVITPYHPFPELEVVDPQVWAEMTTEERRKWIADRTEIELIDLNQPVQVTPPQSRMTALHFNSYPEKAKKNAQRAIDWQTKFDKSCAKKFIKDLSDQIIKGTPLGPREISRISNFLSKNIAFKDFPYDESCDSVAFDMLGGSEMMIWANEKVKELRGKVD